MYDNPNMAAQDAADIEDRNHRAQVYADDNMSRAVQESGMTLDDYLQILPNTETVRELEAKTIKNMSLYIDGKLTQADMVHAARAFFDLLAIAARESHEVELKEEYYEKGGK